MSTMVSQTNEVNASVTSVCSPGSAGHGQDSRGSPISQQQHLHELGLRLENGDGSDEQDDLDDDPEGSPLCDDDDDDDDGDRVIYPWMKKIHVAGVGKLLNLRLDNHPSDKNCPLPGFYSILM